MRGCPPNAGEWLLSRKLISSRILGTTSVQLSERKNGFLAPKRHQIKHLEFCISWFGTRGRSGAIPSMTCFYILIAGL